MKGAVVLVPVDRVERLTRRFGERFLRRAFTPGERADCEGRRNAAERLAARLAAKAAARKALPDRLLSFRSIAISTEAGGAPRISVPGVPAARLFVSLSHDGGVAAAAVFIDPGSP